MHRSVLLTVGLALSCHLACSATVDGGDPSATDVTVSGDGGVVGGPDAGSTSPGCASCPSGFLCYSSACVKDLGPCAKDDDCLADSFCDPAQKRCVPYGPNTRTKDPNCKTAGFKSEKLQAPTVRCKWTSEGVRMSPMVADLDGDKKPEIVFITQSGKLTVIRGDSCKQVWQVQGSFTQGSNPALADLDGDKAPEIITVDKTNHVVVYNNKGTKLATSPEAAKRFYSETSGGAAVANLDGKGRPEIVYGGMALRYNAGKLTVLYNVKVHGGYRGVFSTVADVDLDGQPEVVVGNRILDGATGKDKTPASVAALEGGHVAIAQFDPKTPEPEIVLVTSHASKPGTIRIFHPVSGKVIFGPYTFGQENGGPPTVADFDGDGQPEVAAAGYVGYAVFDMECAVKPLPAHCHSPGMRWLKVTQDKSSGCTGSSVFDFNGDGKAEVVYRDECWLRVYDGSTGKVRFAHSITSGTKMELPTVVDVNNDGHADIVVSSDSYTKCGKESTLGLSHGGATQGIFVLQDPQNLWMSSRGIWNQHTYHITNINDDATVPTVEKNNWSSWNNFRQNTQGMIKQENPAPDITSKDKPGVDAASDCVNTWVLKAEICNRGNTNLPAGIKGTFYKGDPRVSKDKLCTAATTGTLSPGQCEAVSCSYGTPPQGAIDLWFWADDDGTGTGGVEVECHELNNLFSTPKVSCPGGNIK